jgi:hypothetical protein
MEFEPLVPIQPSLISSDINNRKQSTYTAEDGRYPFSKKQPKSVRFLENVRGVMAPVKVMLGGLSRRKLASNKPKY